MNENQQDLPFDSAIADQIGYKVTAQLLSFLAQIFTAGLPIWWGLLVRERGYSLISYGLVQTAQILGWGIMNLLLAFILQRIRLNRFAAISFVIMAAMFIFIHFVQDIRLIIVATAVLSAAAGGGISLANVYLGHCTDRVKQYAIQGTIIPGQFALLASLLPFLAASIGVGGIQVLSALLMLLGAALAMRMPAKLQQKPTQESDKAAGRGPSAEVHRRWLISAGVPMVIAYLLYQNYQSIIFNYSERLAQIRGMAIELTGTTLSVAVIVGSAIGALLLYMLRSRSFNLRTLIALSLSFAMIGLLYFSSTGWLGYAVAMTVFGLLFNFFHSIILATNLSIDPSGRLFVLSSLVGAIGGVLLTLVVTAISVTYGLPAILWFSLAELILLSIFMAQAIKNSNRSPY